MLGAIRSLALIAHACDVADDALDVLPERSDVVELSDPVRGLGTEAATFGLIVEQCDDRAGHGGNILSGHDHARVVELLAHPANVEGDDGSGQRHGLEHDQRERVLAGGEGKDVGRGDQRLGFGHLANPVDSVGDTEPFRQVSRPSARLAPNPLEPYG